MQAVAQATLAVPTASEGRPLSATAARDPPARIHGARFRFPARALILAIICSSESASAACLGSLYWKPFSTVEMKNALGRRVT